MAPSPAGFNPRKGQPLTENAPASIVILIGLIHIVAANGGVKLVDGVGIPIVETVLVGKTDEFRHPSVPVAEGFGRGRRETGEGVKVHIEEGRVMGAFVINLFHHRGEIPVVVKERPLLLEGKGNAIVELETSRRRVRSETSFVRRRLGVARNPEDFRRPERVFAETIFVVVDCQILSHPFFGFRRGNEGVSQLGDERRDVGPGVGTAQSQNGYCQYRQNGGKFHNAWGTHRSPPFIGQSSGSESERSGAEYSS